MPQFERQITVVFTPRFENVTMVHTAFKAIVLDRFPQRGNEIADLCLVITELMNNVVEHGEALSAEVMIAIQGPKVLFRLTSDGVRFDPTRAVVMPEGASSGDLPEGGYGLPLVQRLAERLEYEHRDGKNRVTLCKVFSGEERRGHDGD